MREYKRGRSSKNRQEAIKNYVGLSGSVIYVKDPAAREGFRRKSANKTVYVRDIEGQEGIVIIDDMPYKAYLENGRWFLGDMVEVAEVAV